ncbi:MAG: HupE/UreJ family protein [Sedimenticolaceae bacterium]|nr:HupE/UreJ family protein [Sedimenticolaceae bacterium]
MRLLFTLLLACMPGVVLAHAPIEGMDSFYNGVLHPVLVPAHLLAIVSAGLLIGQQGVKRMQLPLITFLLVLIAALTVTGQFDLALPESAGEMYLLSMAVLCGVLVALELELSYLPLMAIAVVVALLVGFDSSQPELQGRAKLAILTGTGVGGFLLILYAAAAAEFASRAWQKIGIRILGSWATASAFIVLAFTFASAGSA